MITSQQYKDSATLLGVEVPAIKAVAEVESGGNGFLSTGEPVILFEPHVFWKELKKRNAFPSDYYIFVPVEDNPKLKRQVVNPKYEDILYEKWGSKPYPPASKQHERLQRAIKINREAALCSASWGKFQVMGFNYKACGCATIQEFINAIYKDEGEHLRLFCNLIKSFGLVQALKDKDWRKFAKGYNGASYEVNKYHLKLNTAYLKHKALSNQN